MNSTDQLNKVIRQFAEVFMHRSGRDFKCFMNETGLSFSQIHILMRLYHGGAFGVSEIGQIMGVSNAAASQALDRLVGLGFVERKEHPEDRRARQLELTAMGRSLIEAGIQARIQWFEEITQSLTQEQGEIITKALTLLTEAAQKTGQS